MQQINSKEIKQIIKNAIKQSLNCFGLNIIRTKHNPKHTLLGLRSLPVRTVIDVGANIGQFAQFILRIFPNAELFCFEPLAGPFQELKSWADKQKNIKLTAFNMAIGDVQGLRELYYHPDHSPSSSLLNSTDLLETVYPDTRRQERVTATLTTLDNAMVGLIDNIQTDILIKLDVQGYEDRVIRGGRNTFDRAKAVLIEVNLDAFYEGQATFRDILLMLHELGYGYAGNLEQNYGDDGHVTFFDALFIK